MQKYFSPLIFTGLCLLTGHMLTPPAVAETSPEQPNHYEFAGKNVSIYYSRPEVGGEGRLSYHRASFTPRQFTGDQIRVTQTEVFELVTVTLNQVPDLKSVSLTLLIPKINLDASGPVLYETRSFFTNNLTTIAGSEFVEGVVQTYNSQPLYGEASQVDTIPSRAPGVIGKVTVSPTCAGPQRPGQVCVEPLADVTVQLFDKTGMMITTDSTDEKGLFTLRAEPGEYDIQIDVAGVFPLCDATPVTIPDRNVQVKIGCDSGLR